MSASSTASTCSDDLSSESSSQMSDEPVLPEEPESRKRRTVVTQQLVSTLITLVNAEEKPDLKKIAASLHISLSTVYRILRKVREGEFIHDNRVVMPAKVRGRKLVFNSRTVEIVLEVMTSDPTMTVARAKAELHRRGIDMSSSTIWRISTKLLNLSHKKISTKLAAVFNDQVVNMRFDSPQRVN